MNINHLAKLGRLELKEEEKALLEKELESILSYISEIKEAEALTEGNLLEEVTVLRRNIFRDDIDPYPAGQFTDEIMAEAPRAEDGYLVVKQIIGGK